MEEPRQQYVNANTYDELVGSRRKWIESLKSRYGGTIDASVFGPDSRAHSMRFTKLMREWNPLHCSDDDLKSIAGKPSKEVVLDEIRGIYVIEYVFDDGWAANTWKFTVATRIIIAVEYIPGA